MVPSCSGLPALGLVRVGKESVVRGMLGNGIGWWDGVLGL